MDKDMKAVLARLRSLRMTEVELYRACGMTASRYSRGRNNKCRPSTRIKFLREIEAHLDQVEAARK